MGIIGLVRPQNASYIIERHKIDFGALIELARGDSLFETSISRSRTHPGRMQWLRWRR